jgi:hypothetical protein
MIWLIAAAVIAIIVGINVAREEDWGFGMIDFVVSGLMGGIVALIILCFSAVLFTDTKPKPEANLSSEIHLKAFSDNFGTSGSFFLGSGAIGASTKYYFYAVNDDGSFYLGSVDTWKAVIKEEDRKDGVMETWTMDRDAKLKLWKIEPGYHHSYSVFRVPVGTVKTDFRADLK